MRRANEWGVALGLAVLAWLHRYFFLLSNRDRSWPFSIFYQGDTRPFYEYALALLQGRVYDEGIPFHPPGFPYVLSLIYRLLGTEQGQVPHFQVRLVMAGFGALSVGLLYLLVRPYLGRTVALVAGLLANYHFGLYVVSVAPVNEAFFLFAMLTTLLLWSRCLEHPLSAPDVAYNATWSPWFGLVLGLCLGGLALTRAESALVAVITVGSGLWGLWRAHGFRIPLRRLLPWVMACFGFALALAPWTLRNYRVLSQLNDHYGSRLAEPLPTFVPITLYGPLNLALANHEGAKGTFDPAPLAGSGSSEQLHITNPRHLDFLLNGNRKALAYITEHPVDYAALVLRKWSLYFGIGRLGFGQWNLPAGLEGTRNPVDLFVPAAPWALLLYGFILFGLWLQWRDDHSRKLAVLCLAITVAGLFTTALFYGYARAALPALMFWLVAAASALVHLGEKVWDRFPLFVRRFGLPLLIGLLLCLEAFGARADRNFQATGSTIEGGKINPDDVIHIAPIQEKP